jgi:hypothetical protein
LTRTHVYIVGAGFSSYAGLPLTRDLTAAVLDPIASGPTDWANLAVYLRKFMSSVFGHDESSDGEPWPSLEDVFTNIDLAANSGHYLGPCYEPSELRSVRRVLLTRIIQMLNERFGPKGLACDDDWMSLKSFFDQLPIARCSFISMNWDTVIERCLAEFNDAKCFDYACDAISADFPAGCTVVSARSDSGDPFPLVKIHGSVNWLYCDNCRRLYWFPADKGDALALQLITQDEANKLKLADWNGCARWHCTHCMNVSLGTRIATFSYLKSLEFQMFQKSWVSAERLLREADKWIFIGYSLPGADYEFKHLLKRVELSRPKPPVFVVVTGGDSASATLANYRAFFGQEIKRGVNFFEDGLTKEAIAAAHR